MNTCNTVYVDRLSFPQEITELHAGMCSALADPTRILILYALAEKRQNVSELAACLGLSQPAVSRHLKTLRGQNLVGNERQGAAVEYYLADERLIQALDMLRLVLRDSIKSRLSLVWSESELVSEPETPAG